MRYAYSELRNLYIQKMRNMRNDEEIIEFVEKLDPDVKVIKYRNGYFIKVDGEDVETVFKRDEFIEVIASIIAARKQYKEIGDVPRLNSFGTTGIIMAALGILGYIFSLGTALMQIGTFNFYGIAYLLVIIVIAISIGYVMWVGTKELIRKYRMYNMLQNTIIAKNQKKGENINDAGEINSQEDSEGDEQTG